MFERVVASRIITRMGKNDLSPNQYGFRAGRFTIDALVRVRDDIRETLRRGGVAIAISIDVKNAFNSIFVVRDKERTDVEVRSRLSRRIDRVLPLGEEDFVREAGRNDGSGGRFLRRAPGVGPRTGPLEYHLRLRPHPNRSFRRLLSYLLRGQHPASRDRLRVRRGSRTRRIGTFRDVVVIRGIGRPGVSAKTEAYGFYRPRNRLPNGLVLSSGGFRIGVGRTFKYFIFKVAYLLSGTSPLDLLTLSISNTNF